MSILANNLTMSNVMLQAYLFNDYWEDIGTIRSFFEANLALTAHVSTKIHTFLIHKHFGGIESKSHDSPNAVCLISS